MDMSMDMGMRMDRITTDPYQDNLLARSCRRTVVVGLHPLLLLGSSPR